MAIQYQSQCGLNTSIMIHLEARLWVTSRAPISIIPCKMVVQVAFQNCVRELYFKGVWWSYLEESACSDKLPVNVNSTFSIYGPSKTVLGEVLVGLDSRGGYLLIG